MSLTLKVSGTAPKSIVHRNRKSRVARDVQNIWLKRQNMKYPLMSGWYSEGKWRFWGICPDPLFRNKNSLCQLPGVLAVGGSHLRPCPELSFQEGNCLIQGHTPSLWRKSVSNHWNTKPRHRASTEQPLKASPLTRLS